MPLFFHWLLLAKVIIRAVDRIREQNRTSQCLRTAARPPATDLSGGRAPEDSFTKSMTSLVEEYAVDFQFDSFWLAVPSPKVRSEDSKILSSLGVDRV